MEDGLSVTARPADHRCTRVRPSPPIALGLKCDNLTCDAWVLSRGNTEEDRPARHDPARNESGDTPREILDAHRNGVLVPTVGSNEMRNEPQLAVRASASKATARWVGRSEEHTSELK